MSRQLIQFARAVTAAGTAVALTTASTSVVSLEMEARRVDGDNIGAVYIGDSTVDKASAQGFRLNPGATWSAPINPTDPWVVNQVFVDADNASDGVVGTWRVL